LVDSEQRVLTPLARPGGPDRQAVAVEGTLAGRAFSTMDLQCNGDATLVWVPMVEGNERLGVVGFELAPGAGLEKDERFLDAVRKLTAGTAELIVAKAAYGDFFEFHRRLQPMSV